MGLFIYIKEVVVSCFTNEDANMKIWKNDVEMYYNAKPLTYGFPCSAA
jgi:hypothetical protein